jgi:hypothetical protein
VFDSGRRCNDRRRELRPFVAIIVMMVAKQSADNYVINASSRADSLGSTELGAIAEQHDVPPLNHG